MSKLGHLCSGAQPALPRPLRRRLLDIHSRPRTVPEVPGGSVAAPDPVPSRRGRCRAPPLADPDEQISRIRFLTLLLSFHLRVAPARSRE